MEQPARILIVGGGTAGWLTACYLSRFLDIANRRDVTITLVDSPTIGTIGVGEGGFPTLRTTLQFLGIDEFAFIRDTAATFKQGIRFENWLQVPRDGRSSSFLHPFEAPLYAQEDSLVAHWLSQDPAKRPPFAEAVTIQHRVSEGGRGPKGRGDAGFSAPLNYAYHFDAERLAMVLAERAVALGVERVDDELVAAEAGPSGIAQLRFERAGVRTADLYIDCTGLHAALIGGALAEPFVSARRYLFTNRALACRIDYDTPTSALPSHTVAAAHEAGWFWDIPLRDRRGVGCVYASEFMEDDRAHALLADYPGVGAAADGARMIRYEPGYRARHWVGNCVAVGMAAGFVEPLEATGIVMIEAAAAMIADFWTPGGPPGASADRFNALMTSRYDNLVNFLKLHYCLSRREEPFWRANTDAQSIPPALQAQLERWRWRAPSRFDFALDVETFAFFNYQYVLYGMEFATAPTPGAGTFAPADAFAKIRSFGEQALRDLPLHRDLIDQINGRLRA